MKTENTVKRITHRNWRSIKPKRGFYPSSEEIAEIIKADNDEHGPILSNHWTEADARKCAEEVQRQHPDGQVSIADDFDGDTVTWAVRLKKA